MNRTTPCKRLIATICFGLLAFDALAEEETPPSETIPASLLSTETVTGDEVWVSRSFQGGANQPRSVVAKVWFDQQFLGDGSAYRRRAKEFAGLGRRELRTRVVATLKDVNDKSYGAAEQSLSALVKDKTIRDLQRHWIINGFTCTTSPSGVDALKSVPGVKKIFVTPGRSGVSVARRADVAPALPDPTLIDFDPSRYKHPWYIRSLQADRVWKEFGITGKGTLNVVHDFNFIYPVHIASNVYRNPSEVPGNGKDDDGNGLIDDCHGFNFVSGSSLLSVVPRAANMPALHGTMCAAIICGTGVDDSPYEFGIAPEGRWAGVVANSNVEAAVQWAIEHEADTYSMSFSRPNLGEMRSHWRKTMEHGSFCGVYFVSGAGNFAQSAPVPKQMRIPEDIPDVVFAAAGIQRDLSRTLFSSKGPVEWNTEHYQDGVVQKPEVCAFNHGLPLLLPDGSVRPAAINGNSFAGPMFCGSIALMLSADPDLLPWDLKEIITSTATDVGPPGVDHQTGHGLINCYRAVKEVLRRKAIRDGAPSASFTGRTDGDEIDAAAVRRQLGTRRLAVAGLRPGSAAVDAGIKAGDIILRVNGKVINALSDLQSAFKNRATEPAKLVVQRGGEELEIDLGKGPPGLAVSEVYEANVFE